ncbi:MAG: hypothetical protein M3139_09215 [Bacteroidota bacterium]|nr:hypothetical protein [Bacteroidota bacterium]
MQGKTVQLNGEDLHLTADDQLPVVTGQPVKAGNISLPALSISFITFEDAGKVNSYK